MTSSSNARPWTFLAGLLALALVGGAWLFFGGGGRSARELAAPAGTPRVERPATDELAATGLEGAGRSRGGPATEALVVDGLVVPVGVRLAGDGALAGVVRERGSGRPVGGARVDLWGVPPTGTELLGRILHLARFSEGTRARVLPIATQVSGADGSFAFAGVRTGSYFLEARGARHVADAVELVRVTSVDARTDADLWVRPGGRVVGRVEHPDGSPAGEAEVHVFPGPGAALREAANADLRVGRARTDARGEFVVAGLPPGEGYDLAVDARGAALTHLLDLDVVAGEDTTVAVTLRVGATVTGRVVQVAEEGDDPVPVQGVDVNAVPRGLRDLHFAREVAERTHSITDAEGRFRLRGVPAGSNDLICAGPGVRPTLGPRVDVVDGVTVEADDLVVRGGPSVRVRVTDAAGAPLAGASASWWVVDWNDFEFEITMTPFLLQSVEGFAYPLTDAEGWVTVGPFAGDDVQNFALYKQGYGYRTVRWDPATDPAELEIAMHAAAAIEGIVLDADAAKPVTSFSVSCPTRIEPQEGAPATFNPYTGGLLVEHPDGRFRVEPVAPGKTGLTISAPGYVSAEVEAFELAEGETKRGVIVKLRRGGTVRGRVEDSTGEPVAGAQVQAVDAKGSPATGDFTRSPRLRTEDGLSEFNQEIGLGILDLAAQLGTLGPGTATTGADGAFELQGLTPGTWNLRAKHREFAGAEPTEVTVALGEEVDDVLVRMSEGGTLVGTITDRFDRPVAGAIVVAASATEFGGGPGRGPSAFLGATGLYQGQSDTDGGYRIRHVPGGSYFVTVTRGDEQLNPTSFLGTLNFDLISVAPEGETRCDVVDSSMGGVRVHGRITSSGVPVERGGIFALGFESENLLGVDAKVAEVGKDGSYEFVGLAPGAYRFNYGGRSNEAGFDVEVPDLPEVRLDLELPSGRIEGLVTTPSGEPLANVWLQAARTDHVRANTGGLIGQLVGREGRVEWAMTGDDGRYAFEELEAGAYRVYVSKLPGRRKGEEGRLEEFAPGEPREVELAPRGRTTDVDFVLVAARAIRGRVVDEAGAPLAKVRVRAWLADQVARGTESATTDEEGRFELLGLSPTKYDVGASDKEHARSRSVLVDLTDASAEDVELVLEEGVELVAWIVDQVGLPVAGATARVDPVGGRSANEARVAERVLEGFIKGDGVSGPDGRLTLGRYAAGPWEVTALLGDRRGSARVELAGSRVEVEVELPSEDR